MHNAPLIQRVMRACLPLAFFALAACTTPGGYGQYPPSSSGSPSTGYPSGARQELQGAVRNVDHGNQRFLLGEDRGSTVDIAYDSRTRLVYQGQQQAVSGLEPGDRVSVLATRDGSLWRAQDIQVLAEARGGQGGGGAERRGAISRVDTRNRILYYTEGGYSGGEQSVGYDSRTAVEYRGQRYGPEALERGDLVRMTLLRGDRGWMADRILVEVSSRER